MRCINFLILMTLFDHLHCLRKLHSKVTTKSRDTFNQSLKIEASNTLGAATANDSDAVDDIGASNATHAEISFLYGNDTLLRYPLSSMSSGRIFQKAGNAAITGFIDQKSRFVNDTNFTSAVDRFLSSHPILGGSANSTGVYLRDGHDSSGYNGNANISGDDLFLSPYLTDYSDFEENLNTFNNILGVMITGVLCILGLLGNCLAIAVLRRNNFSRSPMFYVLRMLSFSDSVFLLCVFTLQTLINLHNVTNLNFFLPAFYYRGYIQYSVWPILMATQMASCWLTVLVSFERFVAICHPLSASYVCTISNVRRAVITVFLTSLLFNIPRYLEYYPAADSELTRTYIGKSPAYRFGYACVLYSSVFFVLPLAALAVLNTRLVVALRRGKRHWLRLKSNQRREQNLAVIPMTVVVVFLVCGSPALVVNVLDSYDSELFRSPLLTSFMVTSNFLVVVSSASNIIIYFLLGSSFRRRLFEMLRCKEASNRSSTWRSNLSVHSSSNVRSRGQMFESEDSSALTDKLTSINVAASTSSTAKSDAVVSKSQALTGKRRLFRHLRYKAPSKHASFDFTTTPAAPVGEASAVSLMSSATTTTDSSGSGRKYFWAAAKNRTQPSKTKDQEKKTKLCRFSSSAATNSRLASSR